MRKLHRLCYSLLFCFVLFHFILFALLTSVAGMRDKRIASFLSTAIYITPHHTTSHHTTPHYTPSAPHCTTPYLITSDHIKPQLNNNFLQRTSINHKIARIKIWLRTPQERPLRVPLPLSQHLSRPHSCAICNSRCTGLLLS